MLKCSLKRGGNLPKLIESMCDLTFSVFLSIKLPQIHYPLKSVWKYLEKYHLFREEITTTKIAFYND